MRSYQHTDLTRRIIGAAIAVHKELKPGLDEKLYERALCIELAEQHIQFEQQPEYEVHYKGHFVGSKQPDLIVEKKVIADAKCVEAFTSAHEAQMLGYLNLTGLDLALLLNFKVWPLGKKRIVNTLHN